MERLTIVCVSVCVCVSYPSRARGARPAVRLGLPVGRRLSFEAPSFHDALESFPNPAQRCNRKRTTTSAVTRHRSWTAPISTLKCHSSVWQNLALKCLLSFFVFLEPISFLQGSFPPLPLSFQRVNQAAAEEISSRQRLTGRWRKEKKEAPTHVLAVTSTYWPGRKCAAYRGVPEHITHRRAEFRELPRQSAAPAAARGGFTATS